MRISTVYACVKVIAETIASLPLFLYKRRPDGGKEPAIDHYLFPIIHDRISSELTNYEFFEMALSFLCLNGNSVGWKQMSASGQLQEIMPLAWQRVQIERKEGRLLYRYNPPANSKIQKQLILTDKDVWHARNLTTDADGFIGLSPIAQAREAIGMAMAAEEYGAKFFANDAAPSGILKLPGTLKEDAQKRLKASWNEKQTGDNRFKVAVLEGGVEWQQVSISNNDAQFLETRNFQVEEICRIFRVPSVLVQHPDKTMTYASAEQFMIAFQVHCIRPWCVRLESSLERSLLNDKERRKYFIEFNIDGLVRGDIKQRYEAYGMAKQNKIMTTNEIRALENMNPLAGGDILENPNIGPVQDKSGDNNNANAST
jgi:HK97 family phage portal protein